MHGGGEQPVLPARGAEGRLALEGLLRRAGPKCRFSGIDWQDLIPHGIAVESGRDSEYVDAKDHDSSSAVTSQY